MKKILSLALVLVMALSVCSISAFAANESLEIKISGDNGAVNDIIDVDIYMNNFDKFFAAQVSVAFDPAVVKPLNNTAYVNAGRVQAITTSAQASTSFTNSHKNDLDDYIDWSYLGLFDAEVAACDLTNGAFTYALSGSSSFLDGIMMPSADPYRLITIRFLRLTAEEDAGFGISTAVPANATGMKFTKAEGGEAITSMPVTVTGAYAPSEEPDFNATVDGTTITCTGKVDATVTNYGVEFTKESTVTGDRAQKYYGAMNGNTVSDGADGTTTFTFGDWDGTFEIILNGVHAGTKVLNFFANDTIITEAGTFTLTVE